MCVFAMKFCLDLNPLDWFVTSTAPSLNHVRSNIHALTPCPSPFLLKSHLAHHPEAEKTSDLQTRLLKEYTLQSHNGTPANCTYANFERFTHVLEELSLITSGLSEMEGVHHTLHQDIQALLGAYNDKEARSKEESEIGRKQLSKVQYEFRKVEASTRMLTEEMRLVDASLNSISGRYRQRQRQLEGLRVELDSELHWLQQILGSLQPEGDNSDDREVHTKDMQQDQAG